MDDDDLIWSAAAGAAALLGAQLARKGLSKAWIHRRGALPGNPAKGEGTWAEAVAWAVASGVAVGVARLLAQRGVAVVFEKQRGVTPGVTADSASA